MHWKVGEELKVYDTGLNQIELFKTPDNIELNVEDFNRKVIKLFNGQLQPVLEAFNDALWADDQKSA